MKALAVIPARYASSRFPGKPLAEILGKPMIQWVYERSLSAKTVTDVIVATDDQRIMDAVSEFDGAAMMTSTDHRSGTDRVLEVASSTSSLPDVVLNIQGDEPGLHPEHLDALVSAFSESTVDIATLICPIRSKADLNDPNLVKCLRAEDGRALAFSRAPIPHHRDDPESFENSWQHIGVYAFRSSILERLGRLPGSTLERIESLEQLRWMEHGFTSQTRIVDVAPVGVDSPEDIQRVIPFLEV